MANILVVDDDKTQRNLLRTALSERGHAVEVATTGRAAIEAGMRLRPDVLITDWLLKERPNGFQVSLCLRAIRAETHTILVTGFPSQDVRQGALESRAFGYFTKPLDLDKLEAAVRKAAETPPLPVTEAFALIEYGESGEIVFANGEARKLLELPAVLSADVVMSKVFARRSLVTLDSRRSEWVAVSTAPPQSLVFEAFSIYSGHGNRCAILVPERAGEQKRNESVRLLIDATSQSLRSQAFKKADRRVLVIDEDRLQRRLITRQLDCLGAQFHSADSSERALEILETDRDVGVVIIDYGTDAALLKDIVRKILDLRPDVRIVGTSSALRKREFHDLGAEAFVVKPPSKEALQEVLREGA